MTLAQRRGLSGRADTQALLGDRVRVLRLRGPWVKVVVPDQPTPRDRRGYPGWVPARQLTARAPADSTRVVTVIRPTAWLRTDDAAATKVVEVSFGTRLPYKGVVGRFVRLTTPLGAVRRINAAAVSVHPRQEPALPRTRASLVATAQLFNELPYLWAGASGFGPDCSGLIWVDYRAHGITIPRDAAAQAANGMPVATTAVRRGDLLFYAAGGLVHHVAMYAGDGLMVHAPRTGSTVETIPVAKAEYAGARSYLR
jgi:cell wall-associated NlpC family hydrolase